MKLNPIEKNRLTVRFFATAFSNSNEISLISCAVIESICYREIGLVSTENVTCV